MNSELQRGGSISLRAWLVRRQGLAEDEAAGLETVALGRNFRQVGALQRWILLPSLVCVFILPILLPVLELFWVACMRCLYHDIFHRGLGIEGQQEQVAAARQAALLPVPGRAAVARLSAASAIRLSSSDRSTCGTMPTCLIRAPRLG